MENPGAVLAFTYVGEGTPGAAEQPPVVSEVRKSEEVALPAPIVDGVPPRFTAAQAAKGKTAYDATCAVCHGSTMTNGAYGTPLADEYFKTKWFHRSVRALYDRARTTMPPSNPGLLPADTYADVVAYILQVNGFKAGKAPLKGNGKGFDKMVLK
jgi:mono/diheme cytochrome c family protein